MSSLCHHLPFKKSQFRQQRRKKLTRHYITTTSSTLISCFRRYFRQMHLTKNDSSPLYITAAAMEPICQRIASECKASMKKSSICCPLTCLLCEHFIIEPLTLFCGHTFCENCILYEEFYPTNNCPHCLKNSTQGQNLSPVDYARRNPTSKNLFLQQLFERPEKLRSMNQNSSICRQAQNEFSKQNYQRTIELYSLALENCEFFIFFLSRRTRLI